MTAVAILNFQLQLPAIFTREGDWIVGCFPNLDVTSQGRTQQEAEHNLIEAAQLFIESCFERNVLDEVLKNCGFVPGRQVPPAARAAASDLLTVPFELLAARNGPSVTAC